MESLKGSPRALVLSRAARKWRKSESRGGEGKSEIERLPAHIAATDQNKKRIEEILLVEKGAEVTP